MKKVNLKIKEIEKLKKDLNISDIDILNNEIVTKIKKEFLKGHILHKYQKDII